MTAVVFDVGNVLLDWDARRVYRDAFASDAEIEAFFAEAGLEVEPLDPGHISHRAVGGGPVLQCHRAGPRRGVSLGTRVVRHQLADDRDAGGDRPGPARQAG